MIKCFFIWPYIISDKRLLNKLNLIIFSKISDIFVNSLNRLPLKRHKNNLELSMKIIEQDMIFDKHTLGSMYKMIENIEYYKFFNFGKEYEHLLDILWEINREVSKVVFNNGPIVITKSLSKNKNKINNQQSQINVNKDDWRKIISEKMIDPRERFYADIKFQYARMKMDTGLRFSQGLDFAEDMIQELKKLKIIIGDL
jgi:hypothetical protein